MAMPFGQMWAQSGWMPGLYRGENVVYYLAIIWNMYMYDL